MMGRKWATAAELSTEQLDRGGEVFSAVFFVIFLMQI
jgi:hypothetical protein